MYSIFLVDNSNYVELDMEGVDMSTIFTVADIQDISARKDSITKQINFQGTKANNEAFGSMFHFNKVADSSIPNKLLFNYNPLVTVPCFIYEEGLLLLRGSLRILEVNVNKGAISYAAVVTGTVIEFKNIIQDKLLTDLSFESMRHKYTKENIQSSWTAPIGTNYVYPFIDYGQNFLIDDLNATNADSSKFHGLNFRPAVYVNEYFNRIFSQKERNTDGTLSADDLLPGWSYEIKGSTAFKTKFNSLIIPHTGETLSTNYNGFDLNFSNNTTVTDNQSSGVARTPTVSNKILDLSNYASDGTIPIIPFIKNSASPCSPKILFIDRNVKTSASVVVNMSGINNPYSKKATFKIQLVQRNQSLSTDADDNWEVIQESNFDVNAGATISSKIVTVSISEMQFTGNKNLAVRLQITNDKMYSPGLIIPTFNFTIDSVLFTIPKDTSTPFSIEAKYNDLTENPDSIVPQIPENIKQLDFLKSIMSLFNLYAYTEKIDPKRLIFEKYDDYYAFAEPLVINDSALNWTNKIDYDNFKIKSNLTLPKSYQFLYKVDTDWINDDYMKKFNTPYGSYQYTDAFGVVDAAKIELIFSGTPIIEAVGTKRKYAALYTNDSGNKKPLKTNIRILYYNGLTACSPYTVYADVYDIPSGKWGIVDVIPTALSYPRTTTYFYDDRNYADEPLPKHTLTYNVLEGLDFGRQKEYYFPATPDYINAVYSFENYYVNQVTELTNINISVSELNVWLNELDISGLDLRIPIFIDLGDFGHAYFKVLKVEYLDNKTPTKCTIQKVYMGNKK